MDCLLAAKFLMRFARVAGAASARLGIYLCLLCAYGLSEASAIERDENWPRDWGTWQTATGDWGGLRSWMVNSGITPIFTYTQDSNINPVGGLSPGGAHAARAQGDLIFDMEELMGWQGLRFRLGAYQGVGFSLSRDDIGNAFSVAQIFSGSIPGLTRGFLEYTTSDELMSLSIGRIPAGEVFYKHPIFGNYVSNAINGNPNALLQTLPALTAYPLNQWGVQGQLKSEAGPYLYGGVYVSAFDQLTSGSQGFDLTFAPEDGLVYLLQTGTSVGGDQLSDGLPGDYFLGAAYDSSSYDLLADPTRSRDGNWALYGFGRQMVYREQENQGLTLWGVFSLAPDQAISKFPLSITLGAVYEGLFPRRDEDITSAAVVVGVFSDDLAGQTAEWVFEFNHRFQISDWFYVTPDFQYILTPNGRSDIPDAWVFGSEFSITF